MTDAPAPEAPEPNPAPSPAPSPAPAPAPAAPSPEPAPAPKPGEEPPAPAPEPAPDPKAFKVPDEYKDKPWAKKIANEADVYKQLDNLDTLVGKKTVIPNLKDATPEERETFYAQLRGKDATEYPIPDNAAFPTPPETQAVVADLFMKNGVSPTQAAEIVKGYQELGVKQFAAQFSDEGFKTAMGEAFGAEVGTDGKPAYEKVIGEVRASMKGYMNDTDFKMLDNLPNAYVSLIYRTLGNTMGAVKATLKAYGVKETDMAHFQNGGKPAATDVEGTRQGLRNEMAKLEQRSHTAQEKQVLIDKLNQTYLTDTRLQTA